MEPNHIGKLVQRVLNGESEAFTELYQTTHQRIYFLCVGFMKNEEDAKDALQETYLTAYKHLSQLTEQDKFRSWLEQIAANTCKNMLKKKIPVPTEDDALDSMLFEENELSLSEEYILNREKRQVIMQILREQLTDLQYQTVLLYYFDQLSVRETAKIMECSEAAVKNRISIARSKIKNGVEQYEKQYHDKLYSLPVLPFLTALLSEEAKRIAAPDLGNAISQEIAKQAAISGTAAGTMIVGTGKVGSHILQWKLLAGIGAAVIAAGGAGVAIHNSRQKETAELPAKETSFPEDTTAPITDETAVFPETETLTPESTDISSEVTEALQTMPPDTGQIGEVFTCPYFTAAEYGEWHMGFHDSNLVIFNNLKDGYSVCFDADDSEGHLSPEIAALEMLIDYRFDDFQVITDEKSEFREYEAYHQLFDSGFMYYEYTYFEVNGVLYTISWLMKPEEYAVYRADAENLIEQFMIITE